MKLVLDVGSLVERVSVRITITSPLLTHHVARESSLRRTSVSVFTDAYHRPNSKLIWLSFFSPNVSENHKMLHKA
jgi:hypothetical protein